MIHYREQGYQKRGVLAQNTNISKFLIHTFTEHMTHHSMSHNSVIIKMCNMFSNYCLLCNYLIYKPVIICTIFSQKNTKINFMNFEQKCLLASVVVVMPFEKQPQAALIPVPQKINLWCSNGLLLLVGSRMIETTKFNNGYTK